MSSKRKPPANPPAKPLTPDSVKALIDQMDYSAQINLLHQLMADPKSHLGQTVLGMLSCERKGRSKLEVLAKLTREDLDPENVLRKGEVDPESVLRTESHKEAVTRLRAAGILVETEGLTAAQQRKLWVGIVKSMRSRARERYEVLQSTQSSTAELIRQKKRCQRAKKTPPS